MAAGANRWITNALTGGAIPALGNPLELLPDSATTQGWLGDAEHALGITPPMPHGEAQRMLYAGAQGIGGVLPATLMGAPEAALPTLAMGATGGMGGEIGHQLAPGTSFDPYLTLGGALLGGAVGGKIVSPMARIGNALMGNLTPEGELYSETGLPMRSAAFTSTIPKTKRMLGQYAPLEETLADLGGAIDAHAADLGASRTLTEAGNTLQQRARDWVQQIMPAKQAAAWAPVDAAIAPNTPVPLAEFRNVLGAQTGKGGAISSLIKALPGGGISEGLQQRLEGLDSLLQDKFGTELTPTVGSYPPSEPAVPLTTPTWRDARDFRTALGEVMGTPGVVNSGAGAKLEALYAGLTKDLQNAADRVGPDARSAFDAANAESTRLHAFNKDIISRIIHNDNPNQAGVEPEKAAAAMLAGGKQGASSLARLRAELPDAANELSAAKLRELGLEADTASGPLAGSPAHPNFSARWASLSPEMREALLPDEGARAGMDRLSAIARNARAVAKLRPSMADRAGEALAGAGLGLTGSLLAGHGNPLMGELGGGIGATAGWLAPTIAGGFRRAIANAPLAARYAATAPIEYPLPYWSLPNAAIVSNSLLSGARK
jgi:hypothetical protein